MVIQINTFKRKDGFSLIELILVMAIIAIISGTIWGNFLPSLRKGRDSKRKQDLESIARALELYYYDNRTYPNLTVNPLPSWGDPLPHPTQTSVIYMQKLPHDPIYPNSSYCYESSDGTYYKIYARLENKQDPEIFTTPVVCGPYSDYNYGITSSNITLTP